MHLRTYLQSELLVSELLIKCLLGYLLWLLGKESRNRCEIQMNLVSFIWFCWPFKDNENNWNIEIHSTKLGLTPDRPFVLRPLLTLSCNNICCYLSSRKLWMIEWFELYINFKLLLKSFCGVLSNVKYTVAFCSLKYQMIRQQILL